MAPIKEVFQNVVTGSLVICAIAVTGTFVYKEFFKEPVASGPDALISHVDDWKSLTKDRPVSLGSPTGSVKMILFSDYQCPFCKDLNNKLIKLVNENPTDISVITYDLPLTQVHPEAFTAAVASKCAELQTKAPPLQAMLFQHSTNLANANWKQFATSSGIPDAEGFEKCVQRKETSAAVEKDIEVASKLGFESVPILVINGVVVSGTKSQKELERLFAEAR